MGNRALGMFLLLSTLSVQVGASPSSIGGKGLWRVLSGDLEGRGAKSLSIHTETWGKKYEHVYGFNTHLELVSYLGVAYCPGKALGLNLTLPVNSCLDTKPESRRKLGVGDLRLGLALSRSLGKRLSVGAAGYTVFPTGSEETEFSETGEPFGSGAMQLGGKGLMTADFREKGVLPPFRFHLNVGYNHNYGEVVGDEESLNEQLAVGVGLELPTHSFTPFLELTSDHYLYNDTMAVGESPLRLTPGLRFTRSGFNLDLAWDINLSSELPDGQKTEPYAWRLLLGMGWSAIPGGYARLGSIAGRVSDFDTGEPLRAHISFPSAEMAAVESDPLTGSFSVDKVPATVLTLRVEKDGYEPQIAPLFVKGGQAAVKDFVLKRAHRQAVILGKVAESLSGDPVSARVSFGHRSVECSADGNFEVSLPPGHYPVRVSYEGYRDKLDTLEIGPGEEVVMQFSLHKTGPATVGGVSFEKGKAELLPESRPALQRLARFLQESPELKLEIQGHTDSRGSSSFNLQLSQRRADAVKAYLVEQFGVESERVVAKGYGELAPVDDNTTEEGRKRNRRIDALILGE